jgi:hypothetical protein
MGFDKHGSTASRAADDVDAASGLNQQEFAELRDALREKRAAIFAASQARLSSFHDSGETSLRSCWSRSTRHSLAASAASTASAKVAGSRSVSAGCACVPGPATARPTRSSSSASRSCTFTEQHWCARLHLRRSLRTGSSFLNDRP